MVIVFSLLALLICGGAILLVYKHVHSKQSEGAQVDAPDTWNEQYTMKPVDGSTESALPVFHNQVQFDVRCVFMRAC